MTVPALCLFDLGGVAARFLPERRLPELARLLGSEPHRVQDLVWSSGLSRELDSGAYTFDEMCAELERLFHADVRPAEVARVWCLAFEPCGPVLELARRVRARTRVGLLTNNPPALEAGLARHLPALARAFDPKLFSCSLGAAKPEPAVFARVEQLTGLSARELALVDDSERNVGAARDRGWSAIHFVGAGDLRERLESLGWAPA